MAVPQEARSHYHIPGEGFTNELASTGAVSTLTHTAVARSDGSTLTSRTFSTSAASFGPLAVGTWRVYFVSAIIISTSAVTALPVIQYRHSKGINDIPVVTTDPFVAYTPHRFYQSAAGDTNTVRSAYFDFEITDSRPFIAFVTATTDTKVTLSLELLHTR